MQNKTLKQKTNVVICGLLLAIGLSILWVYTIQKATFFGFLLGCVGFGYWLRKEESLKRMWGKTFIGVAIESFALPIAMFMFSVVFVATQTRGGAESVGAAIGGGLAIGLVAILGFFFGAIFLIVGLLMLRSSRK